MRKEQLLLVACVGVGALLIWMSTGQYAEVGATTLEFSRPAAVAVVSAAQPDPVKRLSAEPLKGRPLSAMVRTEKRPPLPDIPVPGPLGFLWVRPIPTPGVSVDHARSGRAPMTVQKVPEKEPDATTPTAPTTQDQPTADVPKPKFNPDKQAKIVRTGGEETIVRLEPTGAFKGQPDWVILEKWPNVTFKVHQLNKDNGTDVFAYDVTPEQMQAISAVHLAKTLENEYWEERVGRRFKDTDHDALVSFAKWTFETLPSHVGIDKATGLDDRAPYGLGAVVLAIGDMKKALALQCDLEGTKLLAEYCRAGYDLEGEVKAWRGFLNSGHANDNGALVAVGDEYERAGAYEAAKANYLKAAQTGDSVAKLKVGLVEEREGEFDAALDALKPLVGVSGVGGRAELALARIALSQGRIDEAASYVEQAKKDGGGAELALVQGGVLYAQGKFADAEKAFALAREDDVHSVWLSDRGMALVGTNTLADLEEAKKAFNACLDMDPKNLLDPYFGLGEYYQRLGDVEHSNNFFETALARSPDNPWILLRLAMIKLRDGQPAKALELGMHLLEVAPGCNDGLWLVGRAAASLEKPDLDKAVTHLRRAVDKEPNNGEFVNEYARALLAAGRIEEAIKVLDVATDVKTGFARTDARMLALSAWARFLGKRPVNPDVSEALVRGQRAQPDDATKEWLDSVRKILVEWDHTREWLDDFDRPPTSTVGNGWREVEDHLGVSINIADGRAVFISKSVKASAPSRQGATILDREEDLGRFRQMKATFKPCQGVEMSFSLHMGPPAEHAGEGKKGKTGFEFGLGCDRNGTMVVWAPIGKSPNSVETIVVDAAGNPRPWPMDDFHTVKIVRKDDLKGIFEVWLDDERISVTTGPADKRVTQSSFEIGSLNAQPGRMFALGFIVDADAGAQVDAAVESVQVTKIYK